MAQSNTESVIREITSQFLPSAEWHSYESIPTGHINRTYRVKVIHSGAEKDFLLQNLNTNVFTRPFAVTHNIVRCASFLQEQCPNYPYEILTPVPHAQSGAHLVTTDEQAWRMFHFVDDARSLDQVTNRHEAGMIGEAFGTFLSYINQDDPQNYKITIPDFHNFTKRYQGFKSYLAERKPIENEVARFLVARIDDYADVFLDQETMDFPSRVIHHDTKANNVLLDRQTGSPKCIIDLDTLMPGDIFSDFGDLMRTVLNPYEEDKFPENGRLVPDDMIDSLFNGFKNPLNQLLTNAEIKYLIKGGKKITLLQVLRFLEDELKGDVYYQVDYQGHNLDRALSQMYLFERMEKEGLEQLV